MVDAPGAAQCHRESDREVDADKRRLAVVLPREAAERINRIDGLETDNPVRGVLGCGSGDELGCRDLPLARVGPPVCVHDEFRRGHIAHHRRQASDARLHAAVHVRPVPLWASARQRSR